MENFQRILSDAKLALIDALNCTYDNSTKLKCIMEALILVYDDTTNMNISIFIPNTPIVRAALYLECHLIGHDFILLENFEKVEQGILLLINNISEIEQIWFP